ncbi:MAG TPA: hypothetical protein VNF04_12205 [Stellaceae bacterium]|nr:hypothetical protein [Stellaceae bacterium]
MDENTYSSAAPAGPDEIAAKDAEIERLKAKLSDIEGEKIARPAFGGEIPKYKIVSQRGCFLEDDTLHLGDEIIEYLGTPNLEMVPLNGAAEKRMDAYIAELNDGARAKAEVSGRPFRRLAGDQGAILQIAQDERRAADAGKLAFDLGAEGRLLIRRPEDRGKVPTMPHTQPLAAQREANRIKGRNVVSATAPAAAPKPEPVPIRIAARDAGVS